MNSNYKDIIDIILTLIQDEEIKDSIVISGSIVPYIVMNKESEEYHSDFYILVKEKKIKNIRSKLKKLSKEYQFNFISDSITYSKYDYGFKIKYENTVVGFFPYSLVNNNLSIKTYGINKENKELNLKKKKIFDVAKSSIIRLTKFNDDKLIRIMTPEFVLVDKEIREKEPGNPTSATMKLLYKICDEGLIEVLRKKVKNTKIKIETKKINNDIKILSGVLIFLIITFIIIAYICFEK